MEKLSPSRENGSERDRQNELEKREKEFERRWSSDLPSEVNDFVVVGFRLSTGFKTI